MDKYMIELPHTNEECLKALDETRAYSRDLLPRIEWGCTAGVHTGWLGAEAKSEGEARGQVRSTYLRDKARVTKVVKFSEKQIESFHKMK